jgi:SNF2 family DNA or RNA helicase
MASAPEVTHVGEVIGVEHACIDGTVEEKILALQQRKRELAAGVLSADEAIARSLTEQDVEDLFQYEP